MSCTDCVEEKNKEIALAYLAGFRWTSLLMMGFSEKSIKTIKSKHGLANVNEKKNKQTLTSIVAAYPEESERIKVLVKKYHQRFNLLYWRNSLQIIVLARVEKMSVNEAYLLINYQIKEIMR